ncbi:hypothetical protein M9H77_23794 [Catharanthus roseus]|uniref:Uncharacterized protein n=1 Tax=Catharanthus roseus TaxID=4058 RepID=A0ACC0AYE2_CATRO|nr:hypothetical protein M9H77_23794 [Catharanthus roseus]
MCPLYDGIMSGSCGPPGAGPLCCQTVSDFCNLLFPPATPEDPGTSVVTSSEVIKSSARKEIWFQIDTLGVLLGIAAKPISILLCLQDSRFLEFQDSLIGMVETSLCNSLVYLGYFPDFAVSPTDQNLLDTLNVNSSDYKLKNGSTPVSIIFRIQYKSMNSTFNSYAMKRCYIGETILFKIDWKRSHLSIPKKNSWNQVNLPFNWRLDEATSSKKSENTNVYEIRSSLMHSLVEISFQRSRSHRSSSLALTISPSEHSTRYFLCSVRSEPDLDIPTSPTHSVMLGELNMLKIDLQNNFEINKEKLKEFSECREASILFCCRGGCHVDTGTGQSINSSASISSSIENIEVVSSPIGFSGLIAWYCKMSKNIQEISLDKETLNKIQNPLLEHNPNPYQANDELDQFNQIQEDDIPEDYRGAAEEKREPKKIESYTFAACLTGLLSRNWLRNHVVLIIRFYFVSKRRRR